MSPRQNHTGVATNTIITRSSLSKGNNKYSLSKEEKKEAKRSNRLRKKKTKCYGCIYNKRFSFCLALSKEIPDTIIENCKYFKKI